MNELSIVLLHAESLAQHGGGEGLRDAGLLESALARAQNLYLYEGVTEVERLAAAYGFGIARNHPFVDGNKRAAFLSIGLFLLRNGYSLDADRVNATQTMFRVASGDLNEEDLAAWIKKYSSAGIKRE
ncbi:MAG: type II toxin-antitoxin system death-on-curing family toxin [Candidatus Angelobacter sp.]